MVIYLLGCIIALYLLIEDYKNTYPEVCEYSEAISIFCFGTMISWITVMLLIWKRIN